MWKQHVAICTALALLALPLYFADRQLGKGGGGWIALDLRGVIIIPYIAFVALHIALSSLLLFLFPTARLLPLHVLSAFVTIGLLAAAFFTYTNYERAKSAADYQRHMETVAQLRKVIELRGWWYVPSAHAPVAIHVRIKVNESGRFSGNVEGRKGDGLGEMIFNTQSSPQHQASKGEEFSLVFPLQILKEGTADAVSMAFYLFKDQTGTAPEDVSIIFEDNPASDYDGHFIRAQIPPPMLVDPAK